MTHFHQLGDNIYFAIWVYNYDIYVKLIEIRLVVVQKNHESIGFKIQKYILKCQYFCPKIIVYNKSTILEIQAD